VAAKENIMSKARSSFRNAARTARILEGVGATLLLAAVACSSESPGNPASPDAGAGIDGSVDATTTDSGQDSASDAAHDAAPPDAAGFDAGPSFLATFDKAQGQLPEGLWLSGATPVISWAPLGKVLAVTPQGTTSTLATLGAASDTFTLGVTSDAAGTLYVGVGAAAAVGGAPADAGPVTPAPGVYTVPAGGGAATAWSLGSAATPAMRFPNGLAFAGSTLYVADSEGVIYTLDAAGKATAWSQDALLAPSQPACGGVVPLAVGANGIVVAGGDVFVTNTDYGRLVRIPIKADGSAGAAAVVAEDCAKLAGADGLARDKDGTFLIAVNAQNRIARVTPTGTISIVAEGAPLATPASLLVDESTSPRRLLVTNSTFFTAADAGTPGVLSFPF
jgi:hypothetical protein